MTNSGVLSKALGLPTKLRKLRGSLSQKEFSQKLGIPLRSYQRYESGERAPSQNAIKLIFEKTGNQDADFIRENSISSAERRCFSSFLNSEVVPRVIIGSDFNVYVSTAHEKEGSSTVHVTKMDPELFDRFLRVLEEADKTKLDAIKAQLRALDPKKDS